MITAVLGDDAGESGLAASRWACKEDQFLVVELLMIETVEVALRTAFLEQRWDCIDFMRFFEDYGVPGLQPSEYISIV